MTSSLIATLITGVIANTCGRKLSVIFSWLICLTGSIIIIISPNFWITCFSYSLYGFGTASNNFFTLYT